MLFWGCADRNITVEPLSFSDGYTSGIRCTSGVSAYLTIYKNSTVAVNKYSLGSAQFDSMLGRTYSSGGYQFSVPKPAQIFSCCIGGELGISASIS